MSRRILVIAVLLAVWSIPAAALAIEAKQAADDIEFRGYASDGGVMPIDALEALATDYPSIAFVALDSTPESGADRFADAVLSLIRSRDTVVVLTPDEFGASSAEFDDGTLGAAIDAAFTQAGDSYEEDFRQIAQALGGRPAVTDSSPTTTIADTSSSGGRGLGILLLVVLAVVGFVMWRSSRRSGRAADRRMTAARDEIGAQMSVVANEILEFSDRVDAEAFPEAVRHYRAASETFRDAEDRLAEAGTERDLESLSDALDNARWEMAAAEAIVEGRPVPEKPVDEPARPCFFDPTHGAGVEEATLRTTAGDRTVRVCAADAEKLRRGERPDMRSIDVDGRRVPAPRAPRSHGGGGFDWMDAFSILVGGMGDAMRYGGSRRRGFGLPGGIGGMRIPRNSPRSSRGGLSPVPGPSPRGRRSTGSASRSRSRSRGRARRSR